jgi:hypothetical protein
MAGSSDFQASKRPGTLRKRTFQREPCNRPGGDAKQASWDAFLISSTDPVPPPAVPHRWASSTPRHWLARTTQPLRILAPGVQYCVPGARILKRGSLELGRPPCIGTKHICATLHSSILDTYPRDFPSSRGYSRKPRYSDINFIAFF